MKVVLPSEIGEGEIARAIESQITRRGLSRRKPREDVVSTRVVWMPYFKIRYGYTKDLGPAGLERGEGETALNAMFCQVAEPLSELLLLFRPKLVKRDLTEYSPKPDQVVAPAQARDVQQVFNRLIELRSRTERELRDMRPELAQIHKRMQSQRMFWFTPPDVTKRESGLAKEIARLDAVRMAIDMCLDLGGAPSFGELIDFDLFYAPMLVATMRRREDLKQRYLLMNLVKDGSHLECDEALTRLCNTNEAFKSMLDDALLRAGKGV